MELPLLSTGQCTLVDSVSEQLANPDVIHLMLQQGKHYAGKTSALLYWLCEQRQFRNVCWLTMVARQCKEHFDDFTALLVKLGDTRTREVCDTRGRLVLRDANDFRWSFRFHSGRENLLRGLGNTGGLLIVDCVLHGISDPFWYSYVDGNWKFIWMWPVPPEDLPKEMAHCTATIEM